MANVIIDDSNLTNIANAIRNNYDTSDTYKPREMSTAINNNAGNIKTTLETLSTPSVQNPTTNDYLTQLTTDKGTLKTNLETKGITNLTNDMSFTDLVPKVLEIPSGEIKYMQDLFKNNLRYEEFEDMKDLLHNPFTMKSMFQGSTQFREIVLPKMKFRHNGETSIQYNYGTMQACFDGCTNLTKLDMSEFDMSDVENLWYCFGDMSGLVDLKWGTNYGKAFTQGANNNNYMIDLSSHRNLTHDSLMSVINNVIDLTVEKPNQVPQKISLGSTNIAKLTSEEIAIATNKGWTVL